MRTNKAMICVAAGVLAASLCGMTGCKKPQGSAAAKTAAQDPLKVTVLPQLMQSIAVGTAQTQEITTEEKASARVQTDASRVARIGSPVEGRITKVLVYEGERVRQGQVLAMLHSNSLSDTQFAFVKAVSQKTLAEQSAERARLLVKSDVIGLAEQQRREAEVLQIATNVEALRTQLQGLGMSERAIQTLEKTRQLNAEYPVVASISGTVIERSITVGQVVQPADQAFLIADLSNLWFVAEVPESQAAGLAIGKTVIATIPAIPGESVTGKLTFVSPVVNPATRTVQARMDLPNPGGLFKPDMLASMTFESYGGKGLTIPSTAVVREENKDQIFVQTSPTEFQMREVELGPEMGGRRVVLKGLSATDKIVMDGAFHINNKRKQDQIKGAGE